MRAVQLALIHFGSTLLKCKVLSRCDSCVIFQQGRGDKGLSTVMLVWEIFQWSISYNSCGSVSSNTDLSSLIKGILTVTHVLSLYILNGTCLWFCQLYVNLHLSNWKHVIKSNCNFMGLVQCFLELFRQHTGLQKQRLLPFA